MATGSYSGAQYIGTAVESISNAPGLVCITEQTVAIASQINLYDIFSREYTSYQIHYRLTCASPNYIFMQFMRNATAESPCRFVLEYLDYTAGTVGSSVSSSTSGVQVGYLFSSTARSTGIITIENPFTPFNTGVQFIADAGGQYLMHGAGELNANTYITGVRITQVGGFAVTGSVHVYGYRRDAIEG